MEALSIATGGVWLSQSSEYTRRVALLSWAALSVTNSSYYYDRQLFRFNWMGVRFLLSK
jgi:hypothetical protein